MNKVATAIVTPTTLPHSALAGSQAKVYHGLKPFMRAGRQIPSGFSEVPQENQNPSTQSCLRGLALSLKATLQPGNRAARSARHLARLPAAHPPVRTRGSRQAGEPAPQQQQRSAAAARTGASRLPHIPAPRISPRLSPASLSPRGGRGRRWRCLRRGAPGQRRPDEPFRAAAAQTGGPARGTAPRPQGGENGAGRRAGWGSG